MCVLTARVVHLDGPFTADLREEGERRLVAGPETEEVDLHEGYDDEADQGRQVLDPDCVVVRERGNEKSGG